MLENVIQAAIGIVVLSVLSSVFAKEELGNSTVPDLRVFNCSLDVQVDKFHSRIHLCSLEGNQIVSQKRKYLPSINIYRYYCINPFGRIQPAANNRNLSKLPDPSATNCPLYSTSCLVSHVTFQCNNNQDGNGVCHLSDQITADSYGYQKHWKPKAVYPPASSGDLKGSTASISMQGGPCYYCNNSKRKLSTVIGFYCDERITGKGKPIIKQNPTKSFPEVLFHWNTSAACYEFIPNEQCTFPDFFKIQCKQNSFGCGDSSHQYRLPPSANNSITKSINARTTFTFGFCAEKVQCPTTENNVMICRKEGQESKALAYYSDSIDFVARPTGFVIQIRERLFGGSLKAVISFECSTSTSDTRMTVLENDSLPLLLTLKHRCFCPNSQTCQAEPPVPSPSSSSIKKIFEELMMVIVPVCFIVAILIYVRHKLTTRTRDEVPPPNNTDGDDGGGDDDGHSQGREGASSTDTSPSSTYHSFYSDDTLLSFASAVSNVSDVNVDERTPLLSQVNGHRETRESHL